MANNPFGNFGLDPFLPFLQSYEENGMHINQDTWANAQFGFENPHEVNYIDPNFESKFDYSQVFAKNLHTDMNQMMTEPQRLPTEQPQTTAPIKEDNLNPNPTPNSNLKSKGKGKGKTKAKEKSIEKTSTPLPMSPASDGRSIKSSSIKYTDEEAVVEKRRRNTLASARFRVKKKEKEMELQKTAIAMTEKANMLEKKVEELETQVKWLRSLLLEKTSN